MVGIPSREVEKAFQTSWPNIVCQIEDEVSSEYTKKVEWYSGCQSTEETHSTFLIQNQKQCLVDPAGKGRRARPFLLPSATGASSPMRPVRQYWLMNRC